MSWAGFFSEEFSLVISSISRRLFNSATSGTNHVTDDVTSSPDHVTNLASDSNHVTSGSNHVINHLKPQNGGGHIGNGGNIGNGGHVGNGDVRREEPSPEKNGGGDQTVETVPEVPLTPAGVAMSSQAPHSPPAPHGPPVPQEPRAPLAQPDSDDDSDVIKRRSTSSMTSTESFMSAHEQVSSQASSCVSLPLDDEFVYVRGKESRGARPVSEPRGEPRAQPTSRDRSYSDLDPNATPKRNSAGNNRHSMDSENLDTMSFQDNFHEVFKSCCELATSDSESTPRHQGVSELYPAGSKLKPRVFTMECDVIETQSCGNRVDDEMEKEEILRVEIQHEMREPEPCQNEIPSGQGSGVSDKKETDENMAVDTTELCALLDELDRTCLSKHGGERTELFGNSNSRRSSLDSSRSTRCLLQFEPMPTPRSAIIVSSQSKDSESCRNRNAEKSIEQSSVIDDVEQPVKTKMKKSKRRTRADTAKTKTEVPKPKVVENSLSGTQEIHFEGERESVLWEYDARDDFHLGSNQYSKDHSMYYSVRLPKRRMPGDPGTKDYSKPTHQRTKSDIRGIDYNQNLGNLQDFDKFLSGRTINALVQNAESQEALVLNNADGGAILHEMSLNDKKKKSKLNMLQKRLRKRSAPPSLVLFRKFLPSDKKRESEDGVICNENVADENALSLQAEVPKPEIDQDSKDEGRFASLRRRLWKKTPPTVEQMLGKTDKPMSYTCVNPLTTSSNDLSPNQKITMKDDFDIDTAWKSRLKENRLKRRNTDAVLWIKQKQQKPELIDIMAAYKTPIAPIMINSVNSAHTMVDQSTGLDNPFGRAPPGSLLDTLHRKYYAHQYPNETYGFAMDKSQDFSHYGSLTSEDTPVLERPRLGVRAATLRRRSPSKSSTTDSVESDLSGSASPSSVRARGSPIRHQRQGSASSNSTITETPSSPTENDCQNARNFLYSQTLPRQNSHGSTISVSSSSSRSSNSSKDGLKIVHHKKAVIPSLSDVSPHSKRKSPITNGTILMGTQRLTCHSSDSDSQRLSYTSTDSSELQSPTSNDPWKRIDDFSSSCNTNEILTCRTYADHTDPWERLGSRIGNPWEYLDRTYGTNILSKMSLNSSLSSRSTTSSTLYDSTGSSATIVGSSCQTLTNGDGEAESMDYGNLDYACMSLDRPRKRAQEHQWSHWNAGVSAEAMVDYDTRSLPLNAEKRKEFLKTLSISTHYNENSSPEHGSMDVLCRKSAVKKCRSEEIEALDACKWLRAAGFPQYAQMYEDQQFPIDISTVQTDHEFLDHDAMQSLFRRLNTLNRCAKMKIDPTSRKMVDESDDEEQCALSDKWKYQKTSRRWSRRDLDPADLPDPDLLTSVTSSEDQMTVCAGSSSYDSAVDYDTSSRGDSPLIHHCDNNSTPVQSRDGKSRDELAPEDAPILTSPRLKRAASEKIRLAKQFFRDMRSGTKKRGRRRAGETLEISSPVVNDANLMQRRTDKLNCVDIHSPSSDEPEFPPRMRSNSDFGRSDPMTVFNDGMRTPVQSHRRTSSLDQSLSKPCSLNASLEPSPVVRRRVKSAAQTPDCNRRSYYDNVPNEEAAVELNQVLKELFQNIHSLNHDSDDSQANTLKRGMEPPTEEVMSEKYDKKDGSKCCKKSIKNENDDSGIGNVNLLDPSNRDIPFVDTTGSGSDLSLSNSKHDVSMDTSGKSQVAMVKNDVTIKDCDVGKVMNGDGEVTDEGVGSCDNEQGPRRERRDSGMGSSLTRTSSDRRRPRIRWHSFQKSHRPSISSRCLQMSGLSAAQMMLLRKLSLLKLTAMMERYTPSNRTGWNWILPKFMKRLRVTPDYADRNVFGVPLLVTLQRTGQPLPQVILYAMRHLRRTAQNAVGIFRKSGVRSRILSLRNSIESGQSVNMEFETMQEYDVADLLKLYFREMPECLLTNKLSETFTSIYTHLPVEYRLEACAATIVLLPEENREVLQSLLLFLSDLAEHSDKNQMTASNLAVCFAPSLFNVLRSPVSSGSSVSSRRLRRHTGIPDQRQLAQQKATHECLTMMIKESKQLFSIQEEILSKCKFSYIEQGDPVPLIDLCKPGPDGRPSYSAHIESCIQGLLKEWRDKFRGWVSCGQYGGVEVSCKKVGDGHPLRLWKCTADVEAPPVELLNRLLRERHVWDDDLLKWRIVERVSKDTEVFQYVDNSMAPHPSRDYCVLRSWRTDLHKGACVLVATSVEHPQATLLGGVRGVVLASRYLIEPCGSGRSRISHICRIDTRGRSPDWYNKAFGHICALLVSRIRHSFSHNNKGGPETSL